MALKIGRNVNTNDEASVGSVTTISGANASVASAVNSSRIYFGIWVQRRDAWLRFQPASDDPSERKGIKILRNNYYELPTDNIYTGEISILADGAAPSQSAEISITEY